MKFEEKNICTEPPSPYRHVNTLLVLFVPHFWVSGLTQLAIAQLTEDPRYLRFNVLIREDAEGSPYNNVNAKEALSPHFVQDLE